MRNTLVLMGLATAAVGCTEAKAPVDDDVTAAFQADAKTDLPTNTTYLGDLSGKGGGIAWPVTYTRTPRYRSVGFWGVGGDVVDIWVTSPDGDAVAWLLDFQGNVIASNDDASSDTTDAHIHATLTASNGHYFIYFREYYRHKAHFTVTEVGGHPADAAGDAERAWDAIDYDNALPGYVIKPAALPADAKATFDKYNAKFPNASAWQIPNADRSVWYWVVGDAVEEVSWIDMYDADGNFLVHGATGDGGWQITYWGFPAQSWDPSQQ